MTSKSAYRVSNWNTYNQSIINRGNLTIWFEEAAIARWYNEEKTVKKADRETTLIKPLNVLWFFGSPSDSHCGLRKDFLRV